MNAELALYFHAVILTFLQVMIPAMMALAANGVPWGVSNRETPPQSSDMHGRALRARDNMLENMIIFTGLIVVAGFTGVSTEMTVLGAQLFFWGRLAHFLTYLFGIVWVRTIVWAISVIGMLMIGWELFQTLSM